MAETEVKSINGRKIQDEKAREKISEIAKKIDNDYISREFASADAIESTEEYETHILHVGVGEDAKIGDIVYFKMRPTGDVRLIREKEDGERYDEYLLRGNVDEELEGSYTIEQGVIAIDFFNYLAVWKGGTLFDAETVEDGYIIIGTQTGAKKIRFEELKAKILEEIESIKGEKGDPGESAYEIWLAAGNEGSEEDFLTAMKGKDGDASVTIENITAALGYTPANVEKVSKLSEEMTAEKITMSYDAESKTLKFSRGGVMVLELPAEEQDDGGYQFLLDKSAVVEMVPLVKSAEQPTFVNSVDKMIDPNRPYVLSTDGYFYAYRESENYNLFKLSEVSYQSRLQNDAEGIISSNSENAVTGWIPVEYGKYYALSALYPDVNEAYIGTRVLTSYPSITPVTSFFIRRINARKADGTIIVGGETYSSNIATIISNGTIKITNADAVAIQVQIYLNTSSGGIDIGTEEKLAAREIMFTEGDTKDEAYDKGVNYKYIDGDLETFSEWYNTGIAYNQPADYEDRIISLETDMSQVQEDVERIQENMTNPESASVYYRNVNWGCVPTEYFRGRCESYSDEGFANSTKYADYIEKFKTLIIGHETYVTETELGAASDGQTIYMYDFKPARWTVELTNIPKLIIVAGQHGTEKCNVFGIYYLVKDLLNNWYGSPALEYLRNHVELIIVPVVNTYGFDNFTYKNGNGVNINRNYSSNWKLLDDTTSEQYGGTEAFDQPESQIIRELILGNSDAALVIDSHANSTTASVSWEQLGYYGINPIEDEYFKRVRNALPELMSKISSNFNVDYNLNTPDTCFGFLTTSTGNGILRTWICDNNIAGVLIEGFAGFVDGQAVTADIFKANEEQMVNWLIIASYYLSG